MVVLNLREIDVTKIEVNQKPAANPVRLVVLPKETILKKWQESCGEKQKVAAFMCEKYLPVPPEGGSENFLVGIDDCNNLLAAIKLATNKRFPVAFTPDIIWYSILQGVHQHINLTNLEDKPRFREKFIEISAQNAQTMDIDWASLISQLEDVCKINFLPYSGQRLLDEPAKSLYPVVQSLTSSQPSVNCMKMTGHQNLPFGSPPPMQTPYKRFVVGVHEALPEVQILGSAEEYMYIMSKLDDIDSLFDLNWWTSELRMILEEFIQAINGHPHDNFWKYMTNMNDKTGIYMPYTGWIQAFFPYVQKGKGKYVVNDFIGQWRTGYNDVMPAKVCRMPEKRFPPSVSTGTIQVKIQVPEPENPEEDFTRPSPVPFNVRSGLIGVMQNKKTRVIQPVFGCIVSYKSSEWASALSAAHPPGTPAPASGQTQAAVDNQHAEPVHLSYSPLVREKKYP